MLSKGGVQAMSSEQQCEWQHIRLGALQQKFGRHLDRAKTSAASPAPTANLKSDINIERSKSALFCCHFH